MSITIGLLVDHSELLPMLADAYEREWPEWYGAHDALSDLRERSRRTGLPVGLVAMDGDAAVGTLAIAATSISSHTHLSPWIVGFWVDPARRNRSIGAQLLAHACHYAGEIGLGRLYAASGPAARLFAREGWSVIDVGATDLGFEVTIFQKVLAPF